MVVAGLFGWVASECQSPQSFALQVRRFFPRWQQPRPELSRKESQVKSDADKMSCCTDCAACMPVAVGCPAGQQREEELAAAPDIAMTIATRCTESFVVQKSEWIIQWCGRGHWHSAGIGACQADHHTSL